MAEWTRVAVLIIDRDPHLNELVRYILEAQGFKAVAAPNLDSAVNLLTSVKFDLVITNYMDEPYRRGDRWPILEMFKQLVDPGTPFIVMTSAPDSITEHSEKLGVADVIVKPFSTGDLVARVMRAISGRQTT